MKKVIALVVASAVLTGCDNNPLPDAFTPEMASFSNEFDFDPLRGAVKTFSQTLINEEGRVSLRVTGRLSQEGCFDRLEFHDVENNTGASLELNANFYVDAMSQEKRIRLQGNCQLAEVTGTGLQYDTNDKGFVVSAHNGEAEIAYRYDAEGYPLGRTVKSNDKVLEVDATASSDRRKKHNYSAVSRMDGRVVSRSNQTCDYDRHFNPINCELIITDVTTRPATTQRFSIENSVEYY